MFNQEVVNMLPGVGGVKTAAYRHIWLSSEGIQYAAGANGAIDGANSRDPLNTGTDILGKPINDVTTLRAGLLMGVITTTGLFAPSVIGLSSSAYTIGDTAIHVSAATATEVLRRIGTSGNLTFVGPPTAGGTVASTSVAFTNVTVNGNSSTITVPNLSLNKVSGSLICPADGSQTIRTFIDREDGIKVTFEGTNEVIQFPRIPIAGQLDVTGIINYPADSSLQAYVKASLAAVGPFIFSDNL